MAGSRINRSEILGEFKMNRVKHVLVGLWKDDEGLTTVEYAIAGGLVGAAVIAAFLALGGEVGRIIDAIVALLGQA
jgi:pilus assembly protein Flp/PilA